MMTGSQCIYGNTSDAISVDVRGEIIMLGKIRAFFDTEFATPEDSSWSIDQQQLATAALLIEVAKMDSHFDPVEVDALTRILLQKFQLQPDQLQRLIQLAEQEQDQATSIYQFTQLINQHCSAEAKYELIVAMWQVAFADGVIDKYEEYIIRRVADLIYVAHGDFIRAKIAARESEN